MGLMYGAGDIDIVMDAVTWLALIMRRMIECKINGEMVSMIIKLNMLRCEKVTLVNLKLN